MFLTHIPLDKMTAFLAEDIFKCIFLNENDRIQIQISLKLVPKNPVDNKPALVQVMAWRQIGQWWLSILMHMCSTKGKWVKVNNRGPWNYSISPKLYILFRVWFGMAQFLPYHSGLSHRHCSNHIIGLMQERCNSSALAVELHLSRINPSIGLSLSQRSNLEEYR